MPIATRLFLWLTIFALLPMSILVFLMKSYYESYIVDEVTGTIVETIRRSEDDIYESFDTLSSLSSLLITNTALRETLMGDGDYYEKTVRVRDILAVLFAVNMFPDDALQVTILDTEGQIFTNWSLNFNDYSFLSQQPWVRQSRNTKGHIQWSVFSDAFILEDGTAEKYVGLSRSILSDGVTGSELGTLIISMRQATISQVLERYRYAENDCVYICDGSGEIVLRLDEHGLVSPTDAHNLPVDTYMAGGAPGVHAVNGREYLVSSYALKYSWSNSGQRLMVLHFSDYAAITGSVNAFARNMSILLVVFMLIMLVIVFILTRSVVRPIKSLSAKMAGFQAGAPAEALALDTRRKDEIGTLNRSFLQMNGNINELLDTIQKEQKIKEEYQLNYLKAQLNPHFLFNTLGTIRWMAIVKKADNIVSAIDSLSRVLNYSMGRDDAFVDVGEELDTIREYIKIQNTRYGKMFTLQCRVDAECLRLRMPRFILQPVVENSLKHGFGNGMLNGEITIEATQGQNALHIAVEDNGKGMPPQEMASLNEAIRLFGENRADGAYKIGVKNVNQQIKIRCGNEYGIHFEQGGSGGVRVAYTLPLIPPAGGQGVQ